jgi:phosphate transport system permease protein
MDLKAKEAVGTLPTASFSNLHATMPLQRYSVSAAVRRIDRWMTAFIRIGGIGIILAVFAIFVFILSQILPLFRRAEVRRDRSWDVPANNYVALDSDENGTIPFLLTDHGDVIFLQTETDSVVSRSLPLPEEEHATCFRYHPADKRIIAGTDRGRLCEFLVQYETPASPNSKPTPKIAPGLTLQAAPTNATLRLADLRGSSERRLGLCVYDEMDRQTVRGLLLQQKRSLISTAHWKAVKEWDLSEMFPMPVAAISVNTRGTGAIVIREDGKVAHLELVQDALRVTQQFFPFAGEDSNRLNVADYILGGDSLVFADDRGRTVGYSLFKRDSAGRSWGRTKDFPSLPAPVRSFSASLRNKSFLIGADTHISLRHFTTTATRWEQSLPSPVQRVALGPKHNLFWVLDARYQLHRFVLRDPHPEAGLRAFFGKIWYEGASEPGYAWQSTGGSDEFEPKFSMIPLILGTLKGTFYAMLFSTPLALLAALYTSQFAHPNLRRFIKPTIEIMASLPSVILGFLAALWLAPMLEQRVPSVLLVLIAIPLAAWIMGVAWTHLPLRIRKRIPQGYEFLAVAPFLAAAAWGAWELGPMLERARFLASDAQTGALVPDFRLWWTQTFRLPYEQRNSLVVGFMMGFAVIPLIFTIVEDALSNVPQAMRSASLALGATRWQTAMWVVLPTASAGIFSAIMVGFGRAVGETMIVLMATGNTPITSFNIFSGMRTLSANIAVELPEAPHHSTLYRTLFLGALLLFLMTFVVNTLAEILRHHLREKYKTA